MKRFVLSLVLVCLVVGLGAVIYATTHYEICDYYLSTWTRRVPHEVEVRTGMYAFLYDREDTTTVADSVQIDSVGYYCFDVTAAGEYWVKIDGKWYKKYGVHADSVVNGTVYADTIHTDTLYTDDLSVADVYLGTTYTTGGRVMIKVHNRTSSAMAVGDAVDWNVTAVELHDYISDVESTVTTLDEELADSSGYWSIYVITKGTADGDSVTIYGTNLAGGADQSAVDTVGTTANDERAFPGFWSQIDSFTTNGGGSALDIDSLRLMAVPYMSVEDASSKSLTFAGIVYPSAISADETGWITIWGVCQATCDGAETDCIKPGDLLMCGTKVLDETTGGVDSTSVAIALGLTCDLDDTITVFVTGYR